MLRSSHIPVQPAPIRRIYQGAQRRTSQIAIFLNAALRHGLPETLVTFGGGIGDNLLCSAVFRELRRRGRGGLWMMTHYPELFQANSDVDAVLPQSSMLLRLTAALRRRVIFPIYTRHIASEDRDIPPARHMIATMCELSSISGEVALRPYLTLADDERARGRLAANQIAIQSSGMAARYPMRNKEWFPERFQQVVDMLRGEYTFVQLGAPSDPPLAGAIDLRGKTTLRQSAALLSQSLLFIGQSGFLMHLARAADCRAVIVFGGREDPELYGYVCNENMYTPVPCAPCWLWNTCAYDRRCMRQIEAAAVVEAAQRQIARAGEPLETQVEILP
jgi:ADP-heptose:LPS heptosyltransferase